LCESSQEEDLLVSTVAALIHILPLIQGSLPSVSQEEALKGFSRIVNLLEDMLSLLLEKKDYIMALLVLRSFRMPVEPAFRTCAAGAVKKAGDKKKITGLIHALRDLPKTSADAQAINSYLTLLDRDATPVLLEMLAEEDDRVVRKILVQILKDLGKDQIAFLGQRLSDGRWYFVRNIVNILGESRKEEAVEYLGQVANHKNFQIRQEVVRALTSIGGKKAIDLLVRFLNDKDVDIRFMAVRGLGGQPVSGTGMEEALISFLRSNQARSSGPELKYEAIETLGKTGGLKAARFLAKFTRVRWWKARKPQEELRAVARKAIEDIEGRSGDA
jgi:HEAT repeat protein